MSKNVYIVAAARTPIGAFQGCLSSKTAIDLGIAAVKGVIERVPQLDPSTDYDEIIFGNVLSANLGQDPSRQVAIGAGLSNTIVSCTVNKVCASSMKAIILGAQSIICGSADVIVAGGCESMTNTPYYVPTARAGAKFGNVQMVDGVQRDGLNDAFDHLAMGVHAEKCARDHQITREMQDDFAIESYQKAQRATAEGKFKNEIIPITIKGTRGKADTVVSADEEPQRLNIPKLRAARTVFQKENGTVTAPNASPINDGAAAVILVSEKVLKERNIKPLAVIRGWGEAAHDPADFTWAPSLAIPKALKHAGIDDINTADFVEINEAFSVVGCTNIKLLKVDPKKVNVYGGAVAIGHPLGCSGCRVVVTLLSVLQQEGGKLGVAGICNGGGGASALVIERV